MIAVDTCVFVDHFQAIENASTRVLQEAIDNNAVVLPPAVLTELLSSPNRQPTIYGQFRRFVLLDPSPGYWRRAGLLRRAVRQQGFKAHLGDALIAQSCIDHDVPLLTSDPDFRHYEKAGGLKLAIGE